MESLNKSFAALAGPIFQRHGFASLELAAQWPVIVGDCAAAQGRPEKLSWPRATATEKQKLGGTLVLRVPAALALDVHYDVPRLIERVNQYLGYGAIVAIKVLKSNEAPELQKPKRANPKAEAAWTKALPDIESPELTAALARLGSNAAPAGPLSPTISTSQFSNSNQPPTSSRKPI